MEPTLIMPNSGINTNGVNMGSMPKLPRSKFTKNQIIWIALSLIVLTFLIIYFVVREEKNQALSNEEKMEIINYIKSQPVSAVTETEKGAILNGMKATQTSTLSAEEKAEILNSLKSN